MVSASPALRSYFGAHPVSALIFSAVFLGDWLGVAQLAGAALVFAGAAWGQSTGRQKLSD